MRLVFGSTLRTRQRAAEKHRRHVAGLIVKGPGTGLVGVDIHSRWRICRVLTVGSEVSDILPVLGIHDQDTPVAVPIRDIHAVGFRVYAHVCYTIGLRGTIRSAIGVLAIRAFHARMTDLVDKFAFGGKLQDMGVIAVRRCPGKLAGEIGAIAGDIDKIIMVNINPMLPARPETAVFFPAVVFQESGILRPTPCIQ